MWSVLLSSGILDGGVLSLSSVLSLDLDRSGGVYLGGFGFGGHDLTEKLGFKNFSSTRVY
jgi:hypothetical protein